MGVRMLHTSDWHLGVSINNQRCEPEQRRFLGWLVTEIRRRDVDVLVVAGDLFHYASPSNTAREMYYEFLVECATQTPLEQVVIVGGNHDSPSGLEAPRELLTHLDIQVVGGLPRSEEARRERCLVPVRGASGEPALVVAAVPYVRQASLGVTLESEDGRSMHQRYTDAFADLYDEMAEAAAERYPGVPVAATGHLTCYAQSNDPEAGDYHSAIHGSRDTREFDSMEETSVGSIGAMPPSIFGDRFSYVALGHIHRMMRVGGGDVWYSGTPVATSLDESSTRRVLQVDIDGADSRAEVEPIEVPRWRRLHALEGEESEIAEAISELEVDGPLPPFLFVTVEVEAGAEAYYQPEERLREQLESEFPQADTRPRIAAIRMVDPEASTGAMDEELPELEELSPREVFHKRFQSEHGAEAEMSEDLAEAFDDVQQAYHDEDDASV
jgi:exonuclease SbcD